MYFSHRDFMLTKGQPIVIEQSLTFAPADFSNNTQNLREINDCQVMGKLEYLPHANIIISHLQIKADCVVACAITDVDVNFPIDIESNESYTSEVNHQFEEEVNYLINQILDVKAIVLAAILQQIPLKVIAKDIKEYPKGDGWEVLSQAEYAQREKPIDPRLAKLKEFKFE